MVRGACCFEETNGKYAVILLTGASGFVGRALLNELARRDIDLIVACRKRILNLPVQIRQCHFKNLSADTDWAQSLQGTNLVIHTAARVHVMNDSANDPLIEFRDVNVKGTLNLARQAVDAKVKRFIFISSVKVNGEGTNLGTPFTADDLPKALDPYGISKLEAEVGLNQLSMESDMEIVIIRPPLVYGPGVKANFLSMMRWINSGVPLPLGAIHNKRSLVALDNLVDLIVTCIDHPGAANQTFLAGDGEDLSTTELLQKIGRALGKPSRLFPFPVSLLTLVASLLGKRHVARRLCGSLQVDISKTRSLLGWSPPVTVDQGLQKAVDYFIEQSADG